MTLRIFRLAVGMAVLVAYAGSTRAATVDASSTTMLLVQEQPRWIGNQQEDVRFVPVYELLSVAARGVNTPVTDDLGVVFSGWAGLSLGRNLLWYDTNQPDRRVFGDLDVGFVHGALLDRRLELRLGRQIVNGGVTGSLQVDGGSFLTRLPFGFGLSGFAGAPVAQRFHGGASESTFNHDRGNFAVGGRASYANARLGELGASVVHVDDRGNPGRSQVGGDLRLTPWKSLVLWMNGNRDLVESRWAEANVLAQFEVVRRLLISADARHVEPDLLLPRTSILSIFATDKRNEVGGAAQYGLGAHSTVGADYHFLKQQGGGKGHRANGRVSWSPRETTIVGADLGYQTFFPRVGDSFTDNGYFAMRGFGSQTVDRFTATVDLQDYVFRRLIQGERNAFLATATLGYAIGGGWSALVSGNAGVNPYYSSRFGAMAKLAYNQTYEYREVR